MTTQRFAAQAKPPLDLQLQQAIADGEHGAIALVVARYQGFLKYQCRRLAGGDTDEAGDLFSLVLFKLITEQPEQMRSIRHLGGWLRRVAQNKSIDLQRTRQAEARHSQQLTHLQETCGNRPRSPEQELLIGELRQKIQYALETLPPRLLAVAELRFLHEASYEVIAQELGITQVNARKRAQEARRLLVQHLRPYVGDSDGLGLSPFPLAALNDAAAEWDGGYDHA
ncbi:sigma-70 family RNA polymerase sigma factor [Paludibacterium sp.]|uniref:RNA polymerase sigma factor n=1 Tax=Paludibacterium sp. TaxID=1917523 RepID=UPI0025FBBFFB|nr:sigma-70 family RNA polymerase sigma factor [Paludibacterium sp.]MBV8645849.1 sigma-70 family RNA polymerase sigma factor [Paludibacterium sp.]